MTGRTCLIGHTGFVGGTLLRAGSYDDLYNSSNIADIVGQSYDMVVCAGVSAVKWLANKEPESDRAAIRKLTAPLASVKAREFILISTIDVYSDPASGADEQTPIDAAANHAYGRHRLELELWVRNRFPQVRIIRLPALFGAGLRKNALYDLLHDRDVGNINPAGAFQWYPTSRLPADVRRTREADLDLVNLFTQPLSMSDIIDRHFADAEVGTPSHPAPHYDLKTRHAALFGGSRGYIADAGAVLAEMGRFIVAERSLPLATR